MGIIYLLQPCELVGTSRYKIGMSSKSDLSRIRSYKNGSRYISIMECENYLNVERIIKNVFDAKFKKIAGREFYEGDEQTMLDLFIDIVVKNKNDHKDEIVGDERIIHIDPIEEHIVDLATRWSNNYSFPKTTYNS